MTLDITKFNAVAEDAKRTASNSPRWVNAIDKAVAGIVPGWVIVTELYDSVAITTETGKTYFANGSCQCEAFRRNQPCRHRALARLIERYNEAERVR
jgi:hypothetical protein